MKTLPPSSVISHPISTGTQSGTGVKSIAPGSDSAVFSQGQTLRAVVVAENGANQFTLEIGGSRLLAQSRTALSPGQSLNLQVLSTAPQIELRVIEDTTAGRYFSRSLAATGNIQTFSSDLTLLRQASPSLLPQISSSSLQTLQQFALLQQQNVPGQEMSAGGTTGQALSPGEYGPKVLQQIFAQLGAQVENLFAQGKDQSVPALVKSTLQDIALLFQSKGQLSEAALSRLDQLAPSSKQLFEIISLLQHNSNASQGAKELVFSQLFQHMQLQPDTPWSAANSANTLNTLKSGLAELAFFLKGPESLLQLFSTGNLQSGLLTQSQAEAILFPPGAGESAKNKSGELLQQLVGKLGLNLEGMLAAGNREDATKTVKFALMELVQNLTEQSKLAESGKHALNTLEFFQLAQLQTARQDILVVPLPLPFLEQGYLVVEDYQDQSAEGGKERKLPKHFSLFLKLTPLGNLKIDFLFSGDGVYIRFNSESKEVSNFLATFKDDLNNAITDTLVHGVSFTENSEDPVAALLKRSLAGADAFINTKA